MKTQQRYYALSSLHPTMARVARTITPQEVVVLDWDQQHEVGRFRGKVGTVAALTLHPDGQTVAVAGEEGWVEVWQPGGAEPLARWQGKVNGLRFSPCGERLFLALAEKLVAWDWRRQEVAWERSEAAYFHPALLDVHSNGKMLWSAFGAPSLDVLDQQSGETQHRWNTQDEFMAIAFHPDGKRVGAAINTARSPLLHQFMLLRIGEPGPEREFPMPFMSVSLAISPGGGTVATGDGRGVQLWDMASGAPEGRLAPRTEARVKDFGTVEVASAFLVSTLRFSHDTKGVISDGDRFCCWDLADKQPTWSYPG